MKSYTAFIVFIFVIFFLLLGAWCSEEADADDLAPMEKTEQEALYSAIQGFVGKWWNGSDLYPDPCGWTPIQVLLLCYFYFFTPPDSLLVDSSAKCQSDDLSIPFSFFTLVLF